MSLIHLKLYSLCYILAFKNSPITLWQASKNLNVMIAVREIPAVAFVFITSGSRFPGIVKR